MTTQIDPEILRFEKLYEGMRGSSFRPPVNPDLLKHIDRLEPPPLDKASSTIRKIFVPLCGKSADIPYLLDLGFHVFGIEGVRQAIEDLSEENNLNMKYDAEKSIYHTEDNRLVVFCGDFFQCPIETWGPFQAVWDRGSFGTVAYEQRDGYIAVVRRGLQQEPFRYLLEAFEYKKELKSNPPRAFTIEGLEMYFNGWGSVELIQRQPVTEGFLAHHKEFIGQECTMNVYFIKNL